MNRAAWLQDRRMKKFRAVLSRRRRLRFSCFLSFELFRFLLANLR
jgi:hypothetical protein